MITLKLIETERTRSGQAIAVRPIEEARILALMLDAVLEDFGGREQPAWIFETHHLDAIEVFAEAKRREVTGAPGREPSDGKPRRVKGPATHVDRLILGVTCIVLAALVLAVWLEAEVCVLAVLVGLVFALAWAFLIHRVWRAEARRMREIDRVLKGKP